MPDPAAPKKRSRWPARCGLFLVTTALFVELFARYWLGLGTPPLLVAHPEIEYMHAPNQDVNRFGNRQLYNQYGMWLEDFEASPAPSEFRIMVFGDSVVNGGSLTDHERLATTIVKKQLEKRGNFDGITVGNISAGSWGPGNLLAYSREYGFFGADLVVLVIASHDYADNPEFQPLSPRTQPTKTPISAVGEAIQRYLPRYLPKLGNASNDKPDVLPTPASTEDVAQAMSDLRELVSAARSSGAKFVAIQYLERQEVEDEVHLAGFDPIRQTLIDLEVPILDTQRYFSEAVSKGDTPFRDWIHPTDLGQRLLAQSIMDAIDTVSDDSE